MRAAIDTNVLAYAEGVNGTDRQRSALDLLWHLPTAATLLPVQTLGELYNVLVRKAACRPSDARARVASWSISYRTADTTRAAMLAATDLASAHQLGIWDSLIIAVAAEQGCELLLSEDLQDGFVWRGLTVTNPFAPARHPLLNALLTA